MVTQVVAALLAAALSSPPLAEGMPDEKQVTIIPVVYLGPIQSALADFKKTHANWRCFNVVVAPQGNNLQIGFTSEFLISEDAQTGRTTLGPQSRCGRGAEYLVRSDGKIIWRRP